MKQILLDIINEQYYPSILDIVDIIPEFTGNYEWYFNSNSVIWHRCSNLAISSIHGLLKDKIILAYQAPMSIRFEHSEIAPYHIAKSLTKNYVKPRWIPICFTTKNRIDRDGTTGIEPIDLSMSEIRPTPICIKKNGPKPVFP
jgi:hypothetical protein